MKQFITKSKLFQRIKYSIFPALLLLLVPGLSFSQVNDLDLAYSLLNQGDTAGAVSIFERYAEAYPGDSQIQLQLAYIYTNKKDNQRAINYFQNVVNTSTDPVVVDNARTSIGYLKGASIENALVEAGYKSLAQGDTLVAVSLFEQHLRSNPSATNLQLQLGYIYTSMRNYPRAIEYFKFVEANSISIDEVVNAKKSLIVLGQTGTVTMVSTSNTMLDNAYKMINSGDKAGAITVLEQYLVSNPTDTKARMQLAYLYADRKNNTKALENFRYVAANSKSSLEVSQANKSITNLSTVGTNRKSSRSSIDIYFYNNYDTFQENYISNFLGRYNFNIGSGFYTGIYTDIYLDSRSRPTAIFNDRFAEFGGFVRYAPVDFFALEIRAGYVRQIDQKLNKFNFKPILTFGKRFNAPPVLKTSTTRSENFYFDTYAAALYDHKYENFFGQVTLKEALRFLTGGYSYVDFYLKQQAAVDSEKLDYNNYAEFGGGVGFAPNIRFFPEIFIEASNKTYFENTRESSFQVKVGFLINYYSPL